MGLRRTRSGRGAVAIMTVVIVVFVLIPIAAMTIDLGNAYSRKRMVQRQVDVTAISAGHLLPRTSANQSAIAAEVASYFNKSDNYVKGASSAITATQLLDGQPGNGEITFPDTDGSKMKVLSPPATVQYGLAKVFGVSSHAVQASATVDLFGGLPPKEDVMPMWLPTGCVFGPGTGDTSSHTAATATPTATASATPTPSPYVPPENTLNGFTVTAVTPASIAQNGTTNVDITLTGLPNNSTTGSIRFAYDATTVGVATAVSWTPKATNASNTRTVRVNVNTNVSSTPGTWHVYGLVTSGSNQKVTTNNVSFTVTPAPATATATPTTATPTPSPTSTATSAPSSLCGVSEVGNFGQLDSPRSGTTQLQKRLALNTAIGLDHNVVPWDKAAPPSSNNCGSNEASKITGAQLDTSVREGNNCVDVQQGNDGGALTDGLITGVDGTKGRLDVANGQTTCPSRSNVIVKGTSINNDVLSCFLRGGATLDTLTTPGNADAVSETWLDPAVVKSPRFVWIPVVYAGNRASHEYQALKSYVPGFITDEHMVSGTLVDATTDNGITLNNGGQQVESVQLFTFNPNILPLDLRTPDTKFDPGEPHQVRLVQ